MTAYAPASLTDLSAFRIGHATDADHATGCTVVVARDGAVCGVDVRGGGPATRETDLLRPENMVQQVHAVVLSGGSAFGLEASCGAMDALAREGVGFEMLGMHVPIVTGACLFDLAVGAPGDDGLPAHPGKREGEAAARAALEGVYEQSDARFEVSTGEARGNVGAGTGATVGKMLLPEQAMKSGLGCAFLRAGDLVVGTMVAVNALGTVCDEDGRPIAGCVGTDGRVIAPMDAFALMIGAPADAESAGAKPCANTTIGVVMTNAAITKAQATKTASTAHDAYARAIKPVHTLNDGDTIFCMASGEVAADPDAVSIVATEAMEHAVRDAVRSATGAHGLPAARDLVR